MTLEFLYRSLTIFLGLAYLRVGKSKILGLDLHVEEPQIDKKFVFFSKFKGYF